MARTKSRRAPARGSRYSTRRRAPARRRSTRTARTRATTQTVRIVLEAPQPQAVPAPMAAVGNVVAMTPRRAKF